MLAAADERVGLTQAQREKQQAFLRDAGRPAGYSNLATERDSVVRFMAQPYADGTPAYPKSFAAQLAESAGTAPDEIAAAHCLAAHAARRLRRVPHRRRREPAAARRRPPGARCVREGLKDKIVLVGGTLREIDTHLTPLTNSPTRRCTA